MHMTSFHNTTVLPKLRQVALAATAALALSFAATPGFAQPVGGMMAGGPGMHGGHGMHGDGGFEQMLPQVLENAKASLNLDTLQQKTWDDLVAQSKVAHVAARANRQTVKDAMVVELAKPEPVLANVAAVADGVEQANRAAHIALRNQWLTFYANLSPEQKGVVRDLLQKRLAKMEAFHAGMIERIRQHFAPAAN
jgi:periplasmic protein CpxP/Spy